ncbi:MAG: hypothetical protein H6740_16335 [Alphaproteobacteria bacterium]|nr:hypothetical protein [Alphaproteobacteria bacterium]
MADDATILRTVLAREAETVNEYEALAAAAQSEEVRRLMLHIAREEREHIAVCVQHLARLEADFQAHLDREHPPLDAEGNKLPAAVAPSEAPSAVAPRLNTFTVGSLIER